MAAINFPSDPQLNDEFQVDQGLVYVYNGTTWHRKDSRVLSDLSDVNVDLSEQPEGRYQYLIYNPQGDGTWSNSELLTDGFLVYKGLLDASAVPPPEDPISGHVYIHRFPGPFPATNLPINTGWIGTEGVILEGDEKLIYDGQKWDIVADFDGSLLPDGLSATIVENDGEEDNKFGNLFYQDDVDDRSGVYSYMPPSSEGITELETDPVFTQHPASSITQDEIDSWNVNLSATLDDVLTNGNESLQDIEIGEKIVFNAQDNLGQSEKKSLDARLSDGSFRWTANKLIDGTTEFITAKFTNNTYFVATESLGSDSPQLYASLDRNFWIESDVSNIGFRSINGITYASSSGNYVLVSDAGGIFYSDTYLTWDQADTTDQFGTNDVFGIDYAFNKLIAVGANGKAASSLDGVTWTELDIPQVTDEDLFDVKHSLNGVWMIVGDGVAVISNDNGVTWNTSLTTTETLRCVRFGNNQYAVGADNSSVFLSTDPVPTSTQWTEHQNVTYGLVQDLAHVEYYWIAVGEDINYKLDDNDEWYGSSDTGVGGRTYSIASNGSRLALAHSNGYVIRGYLFEGGVFYDNDLLVTESYLNEVANKGTLQGLVDTDLDSVSQNEVLVYRDKVWTSAPLIDIPEVIRFTGFIDASFSSPEVSEPGTLYIQHSGLGGAVTINSSWPGLEGVVITEGEYIVYSGTDNAWHRSGGSAASQIKSDWLTTDPDAPSFIINKPYDLAQFENNVDPYVQYKSLSLNNVVSNPNPNAFPPHITNVNITVGKQLGLGSADNFLLAEDDSIHYQNKELITDHHLAEPGKAGIVFPGEGVTYNEDTGEFSVLIESLITFIGRLTSFTTPDASPTAGDFYIVADELVTQAGLGVEWGYPDDDRRQVALGDKVIYDRDGVWDVIPDPTGSAAVLHIDSTTPSLLVNNTDIQSPSLSILSASGTRDGLMNVDDKRLVDMIKSTDAVIGDINVTGSESLTITKNIYKSAVFTDGTAAFVNNIELSINPPSISSDGFGVVSLLPNSNLYHLISERAKGNEATNQDDICLKATDSINSFLPSNFDVFEEAVALVD